MVVRDSRFDVFRRVLCERYAFLLTALRQYGGASKRIANQLVLQATHLLLIPFQICYSQDPNGYAGPELVSMWSSILNEVGRSQCYKHMECLVPAVQPCIRSNTVGSVVATLLTANLVGHRDDSSAIIECGVPSMCDALDAAFNGDEFAERQWGPGPVTKAFASITVANSNKELIYTLGLLPKFAEVIKRGKADWPVDGFSDEYHMGAKASACKVVWNLAMKFDVEAQCGNILDVLQGFMACTNVSAVARSNAECAAFAVATFREARGALAAPALDVAMVDGASDSEYLTPAEDP